MVFAVHVTFHLGGPETDLSTLVTFKMAAFIRVTVKFDSYLFVMFVFIVDIVRWEIFCLWCLSFMRLFTETDLSTLVTFKK